MFIILYLKKTHTSWGLWRTIRYFSKNEKVEYIDNIILILYISWVIMII